MTREVDEDRDKRKTRHIDAPLGATLRRFRDARPVTRSDMADHLRVSVATIQRYENGEQRIPAARLLQMCRRLDVDVSQLFADLPHHVVTENGVAEASVGFENDDGRAGSLAALAKAAGQLPTDRLEMAVEIIKALKPKHS